MRFCLSDFQTWISPDKVYFNPTQDDMNCNRTIFNNRVYSVVNEHLIQIRANIIQIIKGAQDPFFICMASPRGLAAYHPWSLLYILYPRHSYIPTHHTCPRYARVAARTKSAILPIYYGLPALRPSGQLRCSKSFRMILCRTQGSNLITYRQQIKKGSLRTFFNLASPRGFEPLLSP